MSGIDRRAFFVGCLAVPLAGCGAMMTARKGPSAKDCNTADHGAHFRNPGCWNNIGSTTADVTWIFTVTGPIPTS
jgi:hypothetical protein